MRYAKQCNGKFNKIIERQDIIKELTNEFYTKDGKSFCNSGTLAKDLILSIHQNFGLMPNDWVYDKVHCMLLNNDEGDIDDSIDGYIDIYTSDLIEWSKQFSYYVDHTIRDDDQNSLSDAITQAQYNVLSDIVGIINDFINTHLGV